MHPFSQSLRGHVSRLAPAVALLAIAGHSFAATICVAPNGAGGCQSSITAAVAAASAGDTISVKQGTYPGNIIITKSSLSLVAAPGATPVINATGQSNGIQISGLAATPNAGVANVVVTGFVVENAKYEGILVINASNVTLLNNRVQNNNKGLNTSASPVTCPGLPAFETSEASDCGEGIHLIAVDHSFVIGNISENNSGGILVSDETGPVTANLIKDNYVHDNGFACGITLASHPAANASGAIMAVDYGISHNVISTNQSFHNGQSLPGAGAGVGIFAPGPGSTNIANVVVGNKLYDNGLPGVTMHNHAVVAMAPPVFFNDNVIIGNTIYGNAPDTGDATTPGTTGIDVFSKAVMTGTIIAQNTIYDESVDVVFNAPAGSTLNAHLNDFTGNSNAIDNIGAGSIDATNNWWGCSTGPSTKCSWATGSMISTAPFLTYEFSDANYQY